MADEQATYSVKVDPADSAAKTDEAADALEKLRLTIVNSKAAIAQMGDSFRNLRGASDEVKAAKEKLKAGIEAERSTMSGASLEIIKAGTSYLALADASKKAAAEAAKNAAVTKAGAAAVAEGKTESDALAKSLHAAGRLDFGREMMMKAGHLKEAFSTASGGALVLAGAVVAMAAAILEAAKAVAELVVRTAEWIFASGLANRQAALQREAWTGSAKDAKALGEQLDELSGKVSTPRAELEKLAGTTVKSLNNARVSGQGIVDTFNAVALASAAMGDEVGAKLGEMVTRAKNKGRVQITPFELQGTGLKTQDIGAQLAKSMHIGVAEATAALQTGRVGVNDFAAALRAAAEVKFGKLDLLQRLGQYAENFEKRLQALTKDIDFEPMLNFIERLSSLFDQASVSGYALKAMVTALATALGADLTSAGDIVQTAFEYMVIGALKVAIALLQLRLWAKEHTEVIKTAVVGLASVFAGFAIVAAVAFLPLILAGAAIGAAFAAVGIAIYGIYRGIKAVTDFFGKVDWSALGHAIVDGIVDGLVAAWAKLKGAVSWLAAGIKTVFKAALGIQSPSTVFAGYGKDTGEGYAGGLGASAGGVQDAAENLVPSAPGPRAGAATKAGGGGGAPMVVHVHFHIGGGDPDAMARAVSSDSVLQKLTKAVEDAAIGLGIAVQAEPSP